MIIYAVIARLKDAAVLVDCCDPLLKGNAPLVTSVLMEHLRDNPSVLEEGDRLTFVQRNAEENPDFFSHFLEACSTALGEDTVDENYFHMYLSGGVVYCCIGDDADTRDQKVNFAFLEHVGQEFTKLFKQSRIQRCNAYGLDKIFKPNMRSAMHYYNINHGTLVRDERVQKVMAKVQDMKEVMSRNVNLLLERGENVDSLLTKSDMLNEDAKVFKKKSGVMLRQQRRKYWLRKAVIGVIIILLVLWATIGVCGVGLHYCRIRENGNGGGNSDNGGN